MFAIQRFKQDVVLAQNYDTGFGDDATNLNGILRGITIVAPDLSGTSYAISILGARGETLWSKATLTENATTAIIKDADNFPLAIPISHNGTPVIKIKSAGTGDAVGTLTWANTTNVANNDTVTIGGVVYTFKTTLTGAANEILIAANILATGTISLSGQPSNNEVFRVGPTTYTFKDTLTGAANEVKIGADAATTLDNIKSAINATAGAGTAYGTGTVANTQATATTNTDTTQLIQAIPVGTLGNAVVFTETASNTTVDGAGVLGGTTAGLYSGDASLTNLKKAINHEATEGTHYGTGTVANSYVQSAAVSSHAIVVTAVEGVEGGADVNTLESSSVLSWGGAFLAGGGESAEQTFHVDLLIDRG